MALIQRGFQSYDGNHAPDFVKNGNFTLNKDSLQARGLVGWWPMFEGGGSVYRDLSGSNIDFANDVGTPVWKIQSFGNYGVFFDEDVELQSVVASYPARLASDPDEFTFSAWWVPKDITTESGVILSIADGGASTSRYSLMHVNDTVDLLSKFGGGSLHVASGAVLTVGQPVLITCTAFGLNPTGADTIRKVFVDGIEQASSTDTTHTPPGMDTVKAGVHADSTPSLYLEGSLWDIRLHNLALINPEVFASWNPSTRWDLYHEVGRRTYFFVPAVEAPDVIEIAPMLSSTPRWDRKVTVY